MKTFGMPSSGGKRFSWRWCSLVLVVVIATQVACGGGSKAKQECPITRIAFGSCANESAPQYIWDAINNFDPQLFIWMGDNIYGDTKRPFRLFGKERTIGPWKNVPRFVPSTEIEMESKYERAKINPGYSRIRKYAKVIGTWDDHDYGLNDAGKEFVHKITNQRLLLDFLDEPKDSPRRKQEGVYASYNFGPVGKQIKVILLDTRYHRDPISSDGRILGDSQLAWLENELKGPKTAITIIGSSIQFNVAKAGDASLTFLSWRCQFDQPMVISNLSATTGPIFYVESWGRFPKERDRLFSLIADSQRGGVFFISGDVHFAEISKHECAIGYPLYDITSSGLTQAVEKAVPPPLNLIVRFVSWLAPCPMRVMAQNCKYKSCTYGQPNFGAIEIDWDATPVTIKLEARDINGLPVTAVNISLSELHAEIKNPEVSNRTRNYRRHCSLEVSLPWIVRYRLAIIFYIFIALLLLGLMGLIYGVVSICWLCPLKFKLD